jgi:hypothetical protein
MNHSIDDEYLQDCALIWGKPELTEKQCDHFRREFDKLIQVNKGKSPLSITFDGTKFLTWKEPMEGLFHEILNAPNRKKLYEKYRNTKNSYGLH